MMKLVDNLYPVSKKDLKKASSVLADAFSEDPILKEMNLTNDVISNMYEMILRICIRYGKVYATSEKFEGIMAMNPDKYAIIKFWHLIRSGAIVPALKVLRKLGKFMKESGKILDEDKKNLNIGPFSYLAVIGVSQEHQGKGFGGNMLRALIEEAENEEKSLYLETETQENVRLYKKFGFEVIKEVLLPELNLPIWEMVRSN